MTPKTEKVLWYKRPDHVIGIVAQHFHPDLPLTDSATRTATYSQLGSPGSRSLPFLAIRTRLPSSYIVFSYSSPSCQEYNPIISTLTFGQHASISNHCRADEHAAVGKYPTGECALPRLNWIWVEGAGDTIRAFGEA